MRGRAASPACPEVDAPALRMRGASLALCRQPVLPHRAAPVKKIPAEMEGLMGFNRGINSGGLSGFAGSGAAIPGSRQKGAQVPQESAVLVPLSCPIPGGVTQSSRRPTRQCPWRGISPFIPILTAGCSDSLLLPQVLTPCSPLSACFCHHPEPYPLFPSHVSSLLFPIHRGNFRLLHFPAAGTERLRMCMRECCWGKEGQDFK